MPRPEDITLSVIQTLSIMQESRFNEITTAESPRWRSAGIPIWATETGFSPSKQKLFLGFMSYLLVFGDGSICDFVLSPANVGGRRAPRALFCRRGKAAGPPVGLSCEGPSGVGHGRTTAAIGSQSFSAKAAKRSGMCCSEARKPSRKARRRFGPPAVAPGSNRERLLVALWPVSGGKTRARSV